MGLLDPLRFNFVGEAMTNDKRTIPEIAREVVSKWNSGAEFAHEAGLIFYIEKALTAERRRADEWEKKYKDLDRSLMAELRDPSGTIWEYAKSLQDKNDALEARLQEAESTAETIRNYRRKDQETIKELEKEVEQLSNPLEVAKTLSNSGAKIKELEARLETEKFWATKHAEKSNELEARLAEREKEHCKDCCCARSWKALGINEFTNKSIPEHIEELRASLSRHKAALKESKSQAEAIKEANSTGVKNGLAGGIIKIVDDTLASEPLTLPSGDEKEKP